MSSMKDILEDMVRAIDDVLGEGYARKNPDLIGKMVQSTSLIIAADKVQDGLYLLGSDDSFEETIQ